MKLVSAILEGSIQRMTILLGPVYARMIFEILGTISKKLNNSVVDTLTLTV